MKFKLLLVGALLVASITTAHAAGPYIGAAGGVSIFHDSDVTVSGVGTATAEYDTGGGFGISAGYNFDGPRLETEFGYRGVNIDKLSGPVGIGQYIGPDVYVLSLMVNGFYDFKTNSPFSPFIGVGLGMVVGNYDVGGWFGEEDTQFGYQLIVGGSYAVNKNWFIDLSYRFQAAASDFEFTRVKVEYMSSSIFAGMRYQF